jgi:hypothetical protein
MFWRTKPIAGRDERANIIREMDDGEPIEPKHAQPASIEQRGFVSQITDADREAFQKTADFGIRFNRHLEWGGFRLLELPNPLLSIHPEHPSFGRNFDVYFNRLKVGTLALEAEGEITGPRLIGLYLWLQLEHPQLFEYGQLRSFLRSLCSMVSDRSGGDFHKRELDVDRAMTSVLWDVQRGDEFITLEFNQSGKAVWILDDEYKRA